MKKLITFFLLAILVAGGSASRPCRRPPRPRPIHPPAYPLAKPWVGPNTPWVYYNGDWFLNGVLQYFFGPKYGWAPVLRLSSHLHRQAQLLVCVPVEFLVPVQSGLLE